MKGYSRLKMEGGTGYIKESSRPKLVDTDAAVFDCDGVLINAANSYTETIRKTFAFLLSDLTRVRLEKDILPKSVIYDFRRSGGFNCDWDTTYISLLQTFSLLPQRTSISNLKVDLDLGMKERLSVLKRLGEILNMDTPPDFKSWFSEQVIPSMKRLAREAEATGMVKLESKILSRIDKESLGNLNLFREILSYPGSVRDSLMATVFDEFFYGRELFRQIYGRGAVFNAGKGLIDNEEAIVSQKALKGLTSLFGTDAMGIASGRSYISAKYTLKKILDSFNSKALVFLEDLEREGLSDFEKALEIRKPQPYALLKAAEELSRSSNAVYVGDSMEDVIMAERANKVEDKFSFVGVYGNSDLSNKSLKLFLDNGADLVVPSVNDLPQVLGILRGSI